MSEKRTVTELSRLGGRVYVYLKDDCTGESILKATEAEGFTFGDGVKPTDRHYSRVMAVHADGTINYVGAMGMVAFGANADGMVRVDFSEYLKGSDDFFIEKL